MKLSAAELIMCPTAYDLMLWFSHYHELEIPPEQDLLLLLANDNIQTLGVWVDTLGLVAALKINARSVELDFKIKRLEFPLDFKSAIAIMKSIDRSDSYSSLPRPVVRKARLTLWIQPDISKNAQEAQELDTLLHGIGFRRDFANNWDYVA